MIEHTCTTYLPQNRRLAFSHGATLPERAEGAALFADISGVTPLTEALTRSLRPRRGIEELMAQVGCIDDALIAQVDRFGGSVVGFAGDAIMGWFDDSRFECSIVRPQFDRSNPQHAERTTHDSAALRAACYADVTGAYPAMIGAVQWAIALATTRNKAGQAAGHLHWARAPWYQGDYAGVQAQATRAGAGPRSGPCTARSRQPAHPRHCRAVSGEIHLRR